MTERVDAGSLLADALLQREAALCLLAQGRPPRDFAGLFVGDDDVRRALSELPGLQPTDTDEAAALRAELEPAVTAARVAFAADLAAAASPLAALARSARLTPADAETLALLAAVEVSPARQRLVAYLQDSVQHPRVTLATLARLGLDGALAPDGRLARAALVTVEPGPWAARMCCVAPRVVWHLRGDSSADPGLPADAVRTGPGGPGGPGGLLLVNGADRVSRLLAAAHRFGRGLLVTPLPAGAEQWAAAVREATVAGLAVVLEVVEPLDAAARAAVARADHLAWAVSSAGELPLESVPALPWREVRLTGGEADDDDWRDALGRERDPAYRLTREQLRLVAAAARADGGALAPAVRRLAGGHLERLAVRIRPRRGWDDLVLPPDDARRVRELAARYRCRHVVFGEWGFPQLPSTGVVALFAGPSGTGKTLAAEVVAGELGLDLYKVDLSSVVSKYIGETEKNLERIFGAAATGDLVLFFDEADALFGKRSEVSDAHDRYANIEVAYLLQRLEAHDGLVVLATNLQRNIDQAFLRRISVAVDFVLPEEPQRLSIWRRSFPASAPVQDLDLEFLARQFKVSGGVIHNASLGAAFLAADEGAAIGMRHVVRSLKREFQKMGRLRTEEEFDRYADLLGDDDAAPAR